MYFYFGSYCPSFQFFFSLNVFTTVCMLCLTYQTIVIIWPYFLQGQWRREKCFWKCLLQFCSLTNVKCSTQEIWIPQMSLIEGKNYQALITNKSLNKILKVCYAVYCDQFLGDCAPKTGKYTFLLFSEHFLNFVYFSSFLTKRRKWFIKSVNFINH